MQDCFFWVPGTGRTLAVVTLGGSNAGGVWLTPNSESPELPLLLHTRQTLGWLGNMNLHSQQEAFSSLPSGDLDICLMLPPGTTGWASSGSETSLDSWDVFPPEAPKTSSRFKGLERITITLIFCRDFALWIWLEQKDRNTGQGWTSLGPNWLWVEFQPPGFTVMLWCYSQAIFEEGIEERVFGQRAVWSKDCGNNTGQDETRVITCFFALSVPWRFYSWEQVRGDSQRYCWCPWHLMLLVITSLRTHSWIQSIFSLVIAPGSPFLGRLTCLITDNSQLKHGMRSWWLTCRPSSKHGKKDGSGRVDIY